MQLVIVEWRDIISCSGWEKAEEVKCPTLQSVGWLVKRDQETVMIANTLDPEDFGGEAKEKPVPYAITAFPTGCIVNISCVSDSSDQP